MYGKDNTSKINEIGSTTHFQCPMLKGANYTTWAIRMQIILEANGLWEMIEPNEKTQADNKKDKTVIAFLYQALPEEQLLPITKHKTTKAIWDALKTRHIGEERVQQAMLQTLKSDFEMLHMKEDETIDTFTTKLTTLINKAAQVNSQESLMFTQHEVQRKPFREYGHGRFNQSRSREQDKNDYQSKRKERASFEEDTKDKSQVTWSAKIAESAEIAESVETTVSEYRRQQGVQKIQKKLINVTVSVKGSKDEDK
nr:zinc finger, CCHC-type [Tanacetum cinerariifolium]